jgi:hypothetical protein
LVYAAVASGFFDLHRHSPFKAASAARFYHF